MTAPSFPRPLDDCLRQIDRSLALRSALMDTPADASSLNESLLQPLHDALALFTSLKIPYALVGGLAAMFYGRARFTEDVDFVAASGHGATLSANPEVMRTYHFDPACTWKLYHDSGIEIDLWKDQFADEITGRAQSIDRAGMSIQIAEVHDLIAMKLRANRIQDDYDVSEIIKHTALDEGVLRSRITPEQYAHFLDIKSRSQG